MSDERIQLLEWKVGEHSSAIKELRADHHKLSNALVGIQNSLKQIKWTVLGAVLYAMATEVGLLNAIKAVLV
ncbi:hypothetical protein [Neptunomonas japonica]|uniref:hypothetical protein n=1 Tax=Neptunomonas japonica TaxID=417574 RepID=UPI001915B196|nr:hypothetical protein [Neptunomonas japonica]